jgi:hypothetical protein
VLIARIDADVLDRLCDGLVLSGIPAQEAVPIA